MSIEKDFVPYKEALELKELGFNEPCIGWWFVCNNKANLHLVENGESEDNNNIEISEEDFTEYESMYKGSCSAPTLSQSFRFFREKYGYSHSITEHEIIEGHTDFLYIDENEEFDNIEWLARVQPRFIEAFKSYEEAELACLKKLIEIVRGGNNEQQ